ncbi:hypothetical protein DFS34DRAFT_144564 [Phlyctochytrium arcticum]|nr:hypothetical protein DFS34DRAFT_144564 [Phlyctochytrium arcticum]
MADVSVSTVTSGITTPKTVILNVYLRHLHTTFHHEKFLATYHSKEHRWNFLKYRQAQKALCEVVRRVKGDDLKRDKSRFVVAFDNGQFGKSGGRKGSRGAPIEKFKKHLRKYVTLVVMDEHHTSLACSGCWVQDCWEDDGTTPTHDEDDQLGLEPLEEEDDIQPRTRNNGMSTQCMFPKGAVNRLPRSMPYAIATKCLTTWNRDTNAARNISFLFWYERRYGSDHSPYVDHQHSLGLPREGISTLLRLSSSSALKPLTLPDSRNLGSCITRPYLLLLEYSAWRTVTFRRFLTVCFC